MFIEANDDYAEIVNRIELQKQKVDYLEGIIRIFNNRGFAIKNMIDWKRFTNGGF
jgi:hypothetical protein